MRSKNITVYRLAICFVILLLALNQSHGGQNSELASAAENKDWSSVSRLVDLGGDINGTQPDGMTALHWSVYHNHQQTTELLLEAGAEPDAATRYHVTPLSIAARLKHSDQVKLLLDKRADPNKELPGGETPLMTVARNGDVKSISHLIDHGAKLDATERRGQTALMWAAASGNTGAVDRLIEAGADINKSNKADFTAMTFAAREGRIKVVKQLLRAGVDVSAPMKPRTKGNRVPRKGSTALTLAVESGHFELAMLLVEAGADPNDQRSGYAPLHALSWVRKPDRGEDPNGDPSPRGSGSLTSLQFVRDLVAAGADVNLQLKQGKAGKAVLNRKGATPFLLASKTADLAYLKLLVELGADPTITNDDGCTAVMAAAGIGVRAVGEEAGTEPEVLAALDYLFSLGLDVNAEDKNKETAMHGAAYRCFPKVIAFLAERGADPAVWDHKNKYGWTPILIGKGYRPGSFKPDPKTVAALEAARDDFDSALHNLIKPRPNRQPIAP